MQAARRRPDFDFPRRLGRRAEAGPRQVLPRVRPRFAYYRLLARGMTRGTRNKPWTSAPNQMA